jgi:formate dehydrogenase iron-sulfur subunit
MNLTRKDFLKSGAGAFSAFFLFPRKAKAGSKIISKGESAAALVDLTRCTGCRSCSRACLSTNRLPVTDADLDPNLDNKEIASFRKWSVVNRQGTVPVKRQCMHCLEPACVSVCPVGALSQTETGPVLYRADRCIGCRYCMMACPFDVPKFEWNSGLTPVIGKCQFCFKEKILKDEIPGCVAACPTGALKFGKRKDLLFEAKSRIKGNPKSYVNRVYGENELGGTSWLYLSAVPFENLGFPQNLPGAPLPSFTWEVVSRIPILVTLLVGIFGGVAGSLMKHDKKAAS